MLEKVIRPCHQLIGQLKKLRPWWWSGAAISTQLWWWKKKPLVSDPHSFSLSIASLLRPWNVACSYMAVIMWIFLVLSFRSLRIFHLIYKWKLSLRERKWYPYGYAELEITHVCDGGSLDAGSGGLLVTFQEWRKPTQIKMCLGTALVLLYLFLTVI